VPPWPPEEFPDTIESPSRYQRRTVADGARCPTERPRPEAPSLFCPEVFPPQISQTGVGWIRRWYFEFSTPLFDERFGSQTLELGFDNLGEASPFPPGESFRPRDCGSIDFQNQNGISSSSGSAGPELLGGGALRAPPPVPERGASSPSSGPPPTPPLPREPRNCTLSATTLSLLRF
jgi:hypothetical protein